MTSLLLEVSGGSNINRNRSTIYRNIEFAARNSYLLTNTLFKHKPAHVTTWTQPERKNQHRSWDGTIRRNPYRNQIDYVMVKTEDRYLIQDSRSYGGITTNTDHKLVVTNLKLEWWKKRPTSKSEPRINIGKLNDLKIRSEYQAEVTKVFESKTDFIDNQEKWTHLVNSCH